ncbi:CrcB protein [Roseinatronobacter thiooxidans]|uniref:Fluoride-specific ion channel FluC n=1 Tax=Roseinatronobacter thiooxidans TaxID=121821 RepID=A0A2W7QZT6_9RHOB|nr:CrcB family protein [Roseinatronobacter thiooxidans]PZX47359.1 CrcB protein [Roseinatronobacter thiooxidans]
MRGASINLLAVGLGGALGTGLRLVLSLAAFALLDQHAFVATLAANVLGAGIIGYLATREMSLRMQAMWMTGFCGGFTTFSLFSLEILLLSERGVLLMLAYGAASLVLWMLAVWGGWRLGQPAASA